jgi:hypothetical protein
VDLGKVYQWKLKEEELCCAGLERVDQDELMILNKIYFLTLSTGKTQKQ